MQITQAKPSFSPLLRDVPGCAWALVILLTVLSGSAPNFLTTGNLLNVASQATLLLLLALPMTFVIMTEGLDLSLGALLSLCTVIFAIVVKSTGSVGAGILACVAVGALVGALNGSLIGLLGIPPFVATLGTMGIATGLALLMAEERDLIGLGTTAQAAWSGTWMGIPIPVWIAVGTYGLFHFLLKHTRFGVSVIALGGNAEALRLAGKRVLPRLVLVYVLAAVYAAIAGILLAGRINGGNPTAAQGMEFDAIAAVVVGGTHFVKGRGTLFGTLLGVILITVLRNGLNLVALPTSIQVAAIGVLVIAALAMESRR
ncbi:ABC transporter permease [Alicycliphilus denitrificans]|uniref:ABC-type transporter, integral membrane subunit n=1 Tax=Alicycliphilus denitrificans (strain DSM 14773 / CIP 107495 / K601) TaxID=596154 RepID=F4G7Q3_ALIDK|nr:ABC transporter permease [Alicycliphilus denitrificans]AEB86650.1 ABC-type transporter, integral membrane subunit [Alicycliphilus denitrificans K601]